MTTNDFDGNTLCFFFRAADSPALRLRVVICQEHQGRLGLLSRRTALLPIFRSARRPEATAFLPERVGLRASQAEVARGKPDGGKPSETDFGL